MDSAWFIVMPWSCSIITQYVFSTLPHNHQTNNHLFYFLTLALQTICTQQNDTISQQERDHGTAVRGMQQALKDHELTAAREHEKTVGEHETAVRGMQQDHETAINVLNKTAKELEMTAGKCKKAKEQVQQMKSAAGE